jgi:peptide/nickel transport system permease protein
MGAYLLRRMISYLILTVVAASLTYLLAAASFSPQNNWLAKHPRPSAAAIAQQLDARNENPATPILARYAHWADGVAHGRLGEEVTGQSVAADMARRIGVSARLLAVATLLGSLGGIALGVGSAVRQYGLLDRLGTLWSFLLLSTPVFTVAIGLQIATAWFNDATGTHFLFYVNEIGDPTQPFWSWSSLTDRLEHLVVPTASLTLGSVALFSRYQRSTMLDVLGGDFLRTARAKGLTRRQALVRHGARTAVIPVVPLLTYNAVLLFTGAVFTEIIFSWHGMGEWFVESVGLNDVNAVAAIGIFTSGLVLIAGLLSELATLALDPRVRAA